MLQPRPPASPAKTEFRALLWLLGIATVLFGLILWPFSGALCWASFIALVFWPVQQRFLRGTGGRRSMAAAATLLLILLIVILPFGLIVNVVLAEASALIAQLRAGELDVGATLQRLMDSLPTWALAFLDRLGLGDLQAMQERLLDAIGGNGQALTARVFSVGQNTLELVLGFFVMLYVLFFLLRDGDHLAEAVHRTLPLRADHTERLLGQVATVVRATIKGNVVVALVQGGLGGLAFWVLGIRAPLLWGAVMATLSLLPAVGAAMVWVPVAIYLLVTGQVAEGIGLALWGSLVIGLIDNVLRPVLVGKETRLPDYLVLVSTLGGVAVFGPNGFVIGPVLAALFLAAWSIHAQVRAEARRR